jgi:hypothetical protein
MNLPVTLRSLMDLVDADATEPDRLGQLAYASELAGGLARIGEELVDRYVRSARESGCSWHEIGAALGVTRQAAHLRFADRVAAVEYIQSERFSPNVKEAVTTAATHGRDLGHDTLGTEHVLLGLAEVPADHHVTALRDAGLTSPGIRAEIGRLVGVSDPKDAGPFVVAPRLKTAFDAAYRHASRRGRPVAGTGELLLALLEANGVAAQIMAAAGITRAALRSALDL